MSEGMQEVDPFFFDRADAHVQLSNEQLRGGAPDLGAVSASMLFGTARFNVFWSASTCADGQEFKDVREKILEYLCEQYRKMAEDHLDDYAANFERYMGHK